MEPDEAHAEHVMEGSAPEPIGVQASVPEETPNGTPHSGWNRRKFLTAAALGTAAAAVVNRSREGLHLGPLTAYADDLSQFQCTANDVRILGPGQVINEPCSCTGTFTAIVQFTVENNAASDRGCITLHTCPATLSGGGTFAPGDIVLQGTIPGKTTQVMTATIANYPCGAGLVCFGASGQDARGRCDSGTCCSTVTWTVPGQDECPPSKQISSKCRHQQICIQGRGRTTLDCSTSTSGVQTTCAVGCGETATLRLCTTNAAGLGPFTFTLNGQSFGPTADTCHDFTVGPITASTTFTGTVTDASGCAKSASVTLTANPITVGAPVRVDNPCSGAVTFQAGTVTGGSGATAFAFSLDGGAWVAGVGTNGNQFVYHPTLVSGGIDTSCHALRCRATRGTCSATSGATTFSQCISTTTGCTP